MRTVFFGTPELAVPTLAALAEHHEVTAVVCQPDRPKGRSGKPQPPPVKEWAETHEIPVHQPEKLNDGSFEVWLRAEAPEICTVAAYGRLLRQPILDIPAQGWLNVHPSLLPKYRGPSPIQAAVRHGDAETGVTIMRMILEMDAGNIVLQERTAIDPEENAEELSARLAPMGARLMLEALEQLAQDTLRERPQDPAEVTFCRMLQKEDGRMDWHKSAAELHNQVRACVPWPMAFTELGGEPLRVLRSRVQDIESSGGAGEITDVEKHAIVVGTGRGVLSLLEVQPAGKKPMNGGEFARGRRLARGMRFGSPV